VTQRTLQEVVEGFYTGHAVLALQRLGALDRLRSGADLADLARELDCEERVLAAVVEYVSHTTDLLTRQNGRYVMAPSYPAGRVAFQLEKFLGAYGPCIERMTEVVRDPALGPVLRDGAALARAFRAVDIARPSPARKVLEAWKVTSLLDLGCGTAALLVELAEAIPGFRGWGIDASPEMVEAAGRNIQRSGVEHRVEVHQSDVRAIADGVAPSIRDGVEALYGRSILNEFFADDGESATAVLRDLRRSFPERLFFVEDYYGCLTRNVETVEDRNHTLLQDLAQVMSGQGVPPADLGDWQRVYESGGCSLLKAYEGTNDGISWFIHVVQL
jgi:SAM-dependent methyltransferase